MKKCYVLALASLMGIAISSQAQVLFSDNFDGGASGNSWTARLSGADAVANFAFDYSTLGIPSAPRSVGGTTVGMSFLANQSAGVFQGVSATPNGQSFTGNFRIRFDMWLNYVGPVGPGGNGTTQFASFGWGVTGSQAEWAGGSSGALFAVSLDGGSATDYRLYKNNAHDTALSTYAAGSQNNSATYHTALFPGVSAPAAQVTLYPGQAGTTDPGEVSFQWRDVTIDKAGNSLYWYVDGNLIASTSLDGVSLAGNDLVLGFFDSNAASSTEPNDFLNTAIFDNLMVTVPEPSTLSLALLGGIGMLWLRRRRN